MTSTSASWQATAIASLPVISAVFSRPFFSSTAGANVAMTSLLLLSFLGDLQHLADLFLVLPLVAEAMRAFRPLFDLLVQPGQVTGGVFAPHLPLAAVVLEFGFGDHGHALVDWAHRFADAAAATGFHVGVVE